MKYSLDSLKKVASKYECRHHMEKNDQAAYAAAKRLGWIDKIFKSHPNSGFKYDWNRSKSSVAREAKKYTTKRDFVRHSYSSYQHAKYHGYLDEICAHMKPLRIVWTKPLLLKEARKYRLREDFKIKSSGAYARARELNLLEEIFKKHANRGLKHREVVIWTDEAIKREARKYQRRTDFHSGL